MTDQDPFEEAITRYVNTRTRGPACGVSKLTPDIREAVTRHITRGTPYQGLATALEEAYDLRVSAHTLSRHGRGLCSCA